MSRKKNKKNPPAAIRQPVLPQRANQHLPTPQAVASPAPASQSPISQASNSNSLVAQTATPQTATPKLPIMISILALLVSGLSLFVSIRQANLNQSAQDRLSGKIRAKFDFVQDQILDPEQLKPFLKKQVGTDEDIFRLDSVDELMWWKPYAAVKNTGEEIIDGLRIEVSYLAGRSYGFGVKQKHPFPLVVNDTSSREMVSFGKLLPQKKASIYLLPLLLEQMLQARSPFYPDQDHEGIFKVRVFARIAGVSTFDAMESSKYMTLNYHWRPTGFSDQNKCNDIIKMQPKVMTE